MQFRPKRLSEANVQAEFYHRCKLADVPVYLAYLSIWSPPAPNLARFDAVAYKDTNIVAIVEFKARRKTAERREKWAKTKQCSKYKQYGLPVFLVTGIEEIEPVVKKLSEMTK